MSDDLEGLSSIAGVLFGQETDRAGVTGCTAIVTPGGAVAAVDVRGAAPATHETDLLAPWATVERIHALLLTGGSAFGLAAATGVVDLLEERGIGHAFGGSVVPIVPAAAIFDLAVGDGRARPDREAGHRVAAAALGSSPGDPIEEGSIGAGTGATVGKVCGRKWATKGGLGVFCHRFPGGERIGALAVVNALGDVVDPARGTVVAGCRRQGEDGNAVTAAVALLDGGAGTLAAGAGESTTLVAVITDLTLDRNQCTVLARMAHDGLARTIVPAHTPLDGDAVFALATCHRQATLPLAALGHAAAHATAMAILRGVRHARGLAGIPGLADDQWA